MFGLNSSVPQVEADEVMSSLEKERDVIILDVRTEDEVARGKISKSINIPLDQIQQKIKTEIPDHEKTIYVYCLSGSRSVVATNMLIEMGYKNTFSMKSGLLSWRSKNYPLDK